MNARRTAQSIGERWRPLAAAVIALAVVAGGVGPAHSAFPGANGRIAFTSDRGGSTELWTFDPGTA